MERRKIQIIAGSTYTISLPKDWVLRNNLKEKNEIIILEKDDRTLVLSPDFFKKKDLKELSLNIDEYTSNIDQALFALYYLGAETISLFSKKEISKDARTKIRKTVGHMSGTEINYEDRQKIEIKVLIDKSKVEINQTIYRICLIIELSIASLINNFDLDEITINENEVDRLYHLISKIVSLSLVDSNILETSKIKNVTLIPSYFLIGKKLENISDNLFYLANHLRKTFERKEVLEFAKSEISRIAKYIAGDFGKSFEKANSDDIKKIEETISKIKDKTVSDYTQDIIRYIIDIEEEAFIISFYKKMLRSEAL